MEKLTPINNSTTNKNFFQDNRPKTINLNFLILTICITLIMITIFLKFKFPNLFYYLSNIYKRCFIYQITKIKYILRNSNIETIKIAFNFLDNILKNINL